MPEYRIDSECPACKIRGILDYSPIGTDGVHYAWIDCRNCRKRWQEGDKNWEELIVHKVEVTS